MLLLAASFATAADLTLRVGPPGAPVTTLVFHDVQPGPLPTVELPDAPDRRYRFALAVAALPGGLRVGLTLDRATTLPTGAVRVERGEAQTLDVGLNQRTDVSFAVARPEQRADGTWTYVDHRTTLSVALTDGAVPEVNLPAEPALDLRISGPDHAPVTVTVAGVAAGRQPVFEVATGRRSVRRVGVDLLPGSRDDTLHVSVVDEARRGQRLVPTGTWAWPGATVAHGDAGFVEHGTVPSPAAAAAGAEPQVIRVDFRVRDHAAG